MHVYHGSSVHAQRQQNGQCHCQSGGTTFGAEELVSGGMFRDPRDPSQPLNSDPIGYGPPRTFMFIYAVNEAYQFRLAPDGNRHQQGAVKHETLFQNAAVRAAGEVLVENGVITDINDASGSYNTRSVMESDPQFALDILQAIEQG